MKNRVPGHLSPFQRFLFDGVNPAGDLVVPATGNWSTYATVESEPFELAAGPQVLRAHMANRGFDLNWIEIIPAELAAQPTWGNESEP